MVFLTAKDTEVFTEEILFYRKVREDFAKAQRIFLTLPIILFAAVSVPTKRNLTNFFNRKGRQVRKN